MVNSKIKLKVRIWKNFENQDELEFSVPDQFILLSVL
jgi:hypothetical protein